MTRRLTFAIIGTIVGVLVFVGLGTLVLARVGARQHTVQDLRSQARDLSTGLTELGQVGGANAALTPQQVANRQQLLLTLIRRTLKLDGVSVVLVNRAGQTADTPPAPVTLEDLQLSRFLADTSTVVTGSHGSLVYAAAAAASARGVAIVVLTRQVDVFLGPAVRWFFLAGAATLIVGALAAVRLGRRLTEPLRQADAATRRIANGDLATRLPDPGPKTDDELADLTRSINTMAATLERSKGLERQFLLSVSHDLRTPLTSIRGYAEAIADGAAPDPAAAAGVILSESRRLERLVRDLLDLAKLEARRFSLDLQQVDLADIASATTEGFVPDAETANVRLGFTPPPQPVIVRTDPDRLAQVVANLVENALKFANSLVTVRVAADASRWALLFVDDDGPGIAPEDLPHVFERLYVSRHRPTRKETGSGLGLAIVRELVEAMGGSVAAEAGPVIGTRMVVRLPLSG